MSAELDPSVPDENALKIDPALDFETRAWLDAELKKRGINAR